MRDVLTFILAGGKGERLNPLTRDRAKPAVPFGGIYRIIDFTLSNCINSGLRKIYVLIQYKSYSLQKHIIVGWNEIVSSQLGEFIDVIPAQQRVSSDWYRGTADAIYQNFYAIEDEDPELVLILAGDHLYKMNYQKMVDNHRKQEADMTVACIPMPVSDSTNLGVIEVSDDGYVCGFQEKPKNPRTIPGDSSQIFASMGIYLFNNNVLKEELEIDSNKLSDHDFGKNIIPQMIKNNKRILVHQFVDEQKRPRYWRDIGTRDAYYQAHMDLLKPKSEFNLFDKNWPMRTYHAQYSPVRVKCAENAQGETMHGSIVNSLISGGCEIIGADVRGSVLSPNVRVKSRASIVDSVIMEGVVVGEGAKIRNAIIDKQVVIPDGGQVGYDPKFDKKRFDVTTSGISIVAKKASIDA